MSLKLRQLSVLAFAKGFTIWRYTTADSALAEGYFDGAHEILCPDDMVLATVDTDGNAHTLVLMVAERDDRSLSVCDLSPPMGGANG